MTQLMRDGAVTDGRCSRHENVRAETAASTNRPSCDGSAETATASASASADTPAQDIGPTLRDVQFDALRNAVYHTARGHHYAAFHRWLMFAIAATGTAGVASLFEGTVGARWFAAATAVLAVLDLVMDLKGKTAQHDRLKQEYYHLLASIEASSAPDAKKVRRWRGKIIRLTAQEPRTYRAVDAIAYNDAADALGHEPGYRLAIPTLVAAFGPIWPFSGYSFDFARDRKT